MSLLLQALQKAAKNREVGSCPAGRAGGAAGCLAPAHLAASLVRAACCNPASRIHRRADRPTWTARARAGTRRRGSFRSRRTAAGRARASGSSRLARRPPRRRPTPQQFCARTKPPSASWVDWLRDRPVWALAIGAAVFLAVLRRSMSICRSHTLEFCVANSCDNRLRRRYRRKEPLVPSRFHRSQ